MSPLTLFLISFTVLFLLGMPIASAMITSSFVYAMSCGISLSVMGTRMFTGLNNFALIAIPLFILTAEVMNRTSVSDRIFDFCRNLVGYIPGGMGHVNITTSIIFAGMSGSAVADAGGIGNLAYQAMVDEGYDKEFSACTTMASSTVGPIIPPSIPAVIYAMVANVSVGKLLFGGVVPGFIMGLFMIVYVYVWSKRHNAPCLKWVGWRYYLVHILHSFLSCILPLLTPVILLGGIYLGVVTTTEAAAIAVLYALILGVIVYRTMNLTDFIDSLKSVFVASGSVLLIIPASKCFSFVLTAENLQDRLYNLFSGFAGDSKFLVAACITILFLILGCLSDPNVNIMVFVPMLLPLIERSGFDPIHVGICIIIIAMIGNITPPVGVVLMTVCSLQNLSIERVSRKLIPWFILLMSEVVLLWLVPGLVTWLPNRLMG
ncbi:MAG: DctM domain-containing protein [Clostridium sp.]|jgi:tripartite ATP-independent transporter DctM subunit